MTHRTLIPGILILALPFAARAAIDPVGNGTIACCLIPQGQTSCGCKTTIKIPSRPGQDDLHMIRCLQAVSSFDPLGSSGSFIERGEIISATEAFGCCPTANGFFPPTGSWGPLHGVLFPFRDYLSATVDDQNNGIGVVSSLGAADGTSPSWIINGIDARQNYVAHGLNRSNSGDGVATPIENYKLNVTVLDPTPRTLLIEAAFADGQSMAVAQGGSPVPINVTSGHTSFPVSGAGATCQQWLDRTPPSLRQSSKACFDSDRGVTVMFGGFAFPGVDVRFNQTWEYDGTRWTPRTPFAASDSPTGRSDFGLVYDSVRRKTVLFGGYSLTGLMGDTWEWDGVRWTPRSSSGPSPRLGHVMAFDALRGVTVLFGGLVAGNTVAGDTWEWNGSTWTQRIVSGPTARFNSAMAYDSVRHRCVLFAGDDAAYNKNSQTWEWNGSSWSLITLSLPPARGGHAAWFDSARNVTVIHGGVGTASATINDTWEWNGSAWTQRPATGPTRYFHAAAYDSAHARAVVFGGNDGSAMTDQTWLYTGSTGAWTQFALIPSARYQSAMAFDASSNRPVLFGGVDSTGAVDAETWLRDTGGFWFLFTGPGPSARRGHSMVADTARQSVILFGGANAPSPFAADRSDTWQWRAGTGWSQLASTGPDARSDHAMAYDSGHDRVVLFGGSFYSSLVGDRLPLSDTWLWNGLAWTNAPVAIHPGNRSRHAMAYDPVRNRVVLFGGTPNNGASALGDTWEWDGTAWSQIVTTGPGARHGHRMVFDSVRGKVVVFGGRDGGGNNLNDFWEWSGTAWTEIPSPRRVPIRDSFAMTYDAANDTVVVVGGFSSASTYIRDVWEFVSVAAPVITLQPSPQTSCLGPGAVFQVAATGPSLTYRWRHNGVNIPGANSPVLTIPSVARGDAGLYDCLVSNSCAVLLSDPAALNVCAPDFNCSGTISVQDIFDFLAAYFSHDPRADFNASGVISVQDIFDFLAAYFAGCA